MNNPRQGARAGKKEKKCPSADRTMTFGELRRDVLQEHSVRPPGPPATSPASAESATAPAPVAASTVFANPDYVGWYRELSALLAAGEKGRLLFDSTIVEPTADRKSVV